MLYDILVGVLSNFTPQSHLLHLTMTADMFIKFIILFAF